MKPHYPGGEIANSVDIPCVLVCFQDREIGELFADLLVSRGVKPVLTESVKDAPQQTRIVTEPCFFPQLSPEQARHCLIVGPKRTIKSIDARCLEQPLTEDGVEEALDYLARPVQSQNTASE